MSYDLNMNRPTYLKRKLQELQDKNYSRFNLDMSYDLNMNRPTYLKRKLQEFQDKNYSRQPQLMKRLKPFIDKANLIDTEPVLSSPNNPLSKNMDVEPLKKLDKKKRISRISREILFAMK